MVVKGSKQPKNVQNRLRMDKSSLKVFKSVQKCLKEPKNGQNRLEMSKMVAKGYR